MRKLLVWSMIITFIALAGCDGARSKFDQVYLGMSRAEAVRILGKPQQKETGDQGELLRWRLGSKTLVLQITKERVSGKQLADSVKKDS